MLNVPGLDHVNIFTDEVDLPQIKPKTVANKHEFFVKIVPKGGQGKTLSREESKRV